MSSSVAGQSSVCDIRVNQTRVLGLRLVGPEIRSRDGPSIHLHVPGLYGLPPVRLFLGEALSQLPFLRRQ